MYSYTDKFIETVNKYLPKSDEEWEIVGFVSKQNLIFTFGDDSKIIGRLFEVVAYNALKQTADELGYELHESEKQTVYPDFYFIKPDRKKIAVDIKTTYRKSPNSKYKFTGGSFTSFMRDNKKNIVGNYTDYDKHYILGVVYDRTKDRTTGSVDLSAIQSIIPAYHNIETFIQEKYRICGDKKGSGNTDNIGTIESKNILPFVKGYGPFSVLGEDIFNDYWINHPVYKDSKEKADSLYNDLDGYIKWLAKKDRTKSNIIREKYENYRIEYNTIIKK